MTDRYIRTDLLMPVFSMSRILMTLMPSMKKVISPFTMCVGWPLKARLSRACMVMSALL